MQIVQRMTVSVAALSLVLAGLVGGVAVPAMLSMQSLKKEIHESQQRIDDRFAAQRYVRDAQASFHTTLEQVQRLSSLAVRKGEELDLVTAIEAAADENRVTQTLSLETANQKDLTPWERQIPLLITATGSYPDVVRFLSDVERLPYLVSINSVTVSSPREGAIKEREGRVTAAIDGTIYWQGDNAPEFVRAKTPSQP
jgi:Tfp pilus assembly protein PilO